MGSISYGERRIVCSTINLLASYLETAQFVLTEFSWRILKLNTANLQ
jgi:hypothetical protein